MLPADSRRTEAFSFRSRLLSAWKKLPPSVRQAFHRVAASALMGVTPFRVRRWWGRGIEGRGPVTVVGFHSSVIGLGRGARLFATALRQTGRDVRILDVTETLSVRLTLSPGEIAAPASSGVVVSHLNPPELILYLYRTGGRDLRGKRHIGYWAWELPSAPQNWKRALRYVDEVWCPSEYTAAALRELADGRVPVRVAPHPVFVLPRPAGNRERFGLAPDVCMVLVAFDLRSTVARKNPEAALQAYEMAAPESKGRSLLICKIVGAEASPTALNALRTRVERRSDIVLLIEELSEADMLELVASADIVLSLHRAEGFGLLMAEAMWLGRAVIATGWSGNMDFMDEGSSALVNWTLTDVNDPQGMYAGGRWADPSIAHASSLLADLIDDAAKREALGKRGQEHAEKIFDREAWIERVDRLLSPNGKDEPTISSDPGAVGVLGCRSHRGFE